MQPKKGVIIKACRKDCFKASSYANICLWSKMFSNGKVIERKGNNVTYKCDVKLFIFRFRATVKGIIEPYNKVIERIELDDGSITSETMTYSEVSGGTKIEWDGKIVKMGKKLRFFGLLLKIIFPLAVKNDLKNFAKFVESGKYMEYKNDLFSKMK